MGTGIKRSQRDYTLSFKLSVVDQVEKGELSYKQAQERYGIQGRSTVLVWLRKHGRLNWNTLDISKGMRTSLMSQKPTQVSPDQRIKMLEVQLDEANAKARLFEAMLDVIRDEYGVKLPKKPLRASSRTKKLFESR